MEEEFTYMLTKAEQAAVQAIIEHKKGDLDLSSVMPKTTWTAEEMSVRAAEGDPPWTVSIYDPYNMTLLGLSLYMTSLFRVYYIIPLALYAHYHYHSYHICHMYEPPFSPSFYHYFLYIFLSSIVCLCLLS